MKYGIKRQDSYSRGELLLRGFFGAFYIALPHAFLLIFVMLASIFLNMIAFWAILITGKYPEGMFNFQVNAQRWGLRVSARLLNLVDGYPAFGMTHQDDSVVIDIERPEKSNRLSVLARAMFGVFYVMIPHAFCLLFLQIGANFVRIIAFWAILITGKYPKGMHSYMVGVMRWGFRVNAYMGYLTDTYPPFSMSGDEADFSGHGSKDLLDN
ncbi:MAG: hypothetical protein RL264_2983 [Bacteroidota bacterium]|jgi:hypothetical protein